MIEALFFYLFASILTLSAALVISAKNPVHAVLYLILCFFNAAGLFVMLGAEFIAMILVIVYVGAVAVLFLFVVMMLDIDFAKLRGSMRKHAPVGAIVGGILLAELSVVYFNCSAFIAGSAQVANPTPDPAVVTNTHALGLLLYTNYVYLFQVAGLILLVAMIGAITLSLRERPGTKRQNIYEQVHRDPKEVVTVEDIATGAGVS